MHPVLAALLTAAKQLNDDRLQGIIERAQDLLNVGPGTKRFDEFWKLYPNKVSKDSARKAWAKMQGDEHADAIIKNVQLRLRVNEWNPKDFDRRRFIPHAATYLNQRRWLDNPIAPQRGFVRGDADIMDATGWQR